MIYVNVICNKMDNKSELYNIIFDRNEYVRFIRVGEENVQIESNLFELNNIIAISNQVLVDIKYLYQGENEESITNDLLYLIYITDNLKRMLERIDALGYYIPYFPLDISKSINQFNVAKYFINYLNNLNINCYLRSFSNEFINYTNIKIIDSRYQEFIDFYAKVQNITNNILFHTSFKNLNFNIRHTDIYKTPDVFLSKVKDNIEETNNIIVIDEITDRNKELKFILDSLEQYVNVDLMNKKFNNLIFTYVLDADSNNYKKIKDLYSKGILDIKYSSYSFSAYNKTK